MDSGHGWVRICRWGNALILAGIAVWFFIVPGGTILHDVRDPSFANGALPACAFRWHRSLSPKYEAWARERVAGGMAESLDLDDISGTEWPIFGSVFYLWATESLQEAWDADRSRCSEAPNVYARGAIEAAADLVADPGHASWVARHWGDDYLHQENVFYRTLLIGGLTAYQRLLGDGRHEALLRDQVETLSQALDASPYGLLDDYPGQCYPTDVLAAVACIRRADSVLGTDHEAFVQRAERAFQGDLLDPVGLPPYAANAQTGGIIGRSRGCGNSFMLVFLPGLWPERAQQWYDAYDRHFWQHRWTADGFREFPKDVQGMDWYMDVDSGPVLAGHGFAACAFGVGAARANGRFDHAYPLAAEMLVTSWPLADGTLAGPRALSNSVDAPYLGEAGILFALTRIPAMGVAVVEGGRLPVFVYVLLSLYFGIGLVLLISVVRNQRRWRRHSSSWRVPLPRVQLAIWTTLIAGSVVLLLLGSIVPGMVVLLLAQLLPRTVRIRIPETANAELIQEM